MFKFLKNRFINLWAIKVYLVSVVVATIALIAFDLSVLENHRVARQELSESNLRLEGERLAIELERHLWQLGEECLRNQDLRRLASQIILAPDEEAADTSWAKLNSQKTIYPWIDRFFIMHGKQVLSPSPQISEAIGTTAHGQREYNDLVRSIETALTLKDVPETDRMSPLALSTPEGPQQFYYTRLVARDGATNLLGFVVNLGWVEKKLVAQCRQEIRMPDDFSVSIAARSAFATKDPPNEIRAPFRTVLPFWELVLPTSSIAVGRAFFTREMIFSGISILILIAVFIMGVLLLLRLTPELKMVQVRSDFVSGVSHELKTPLTLIRLYGETLSTDEELSSEERQNASQIIMRESERLSHLIGNLLDLSKFDRGQEHYRWVEGDLGPVVSESVDIYGRWLVKRGFLLTKDLASDLPPVRFDAEKVTQILFNLMDNSRKYSTSAKSIWMGLWQEGGKVIFELQDKGIGIPHKDQKKILQQFFRAKNSQGEGGCGIGLYLVDQIMKAHGGKVEFESSEGEGSRFRLVFPILSSTGDRITKPMAHPLTHRI